MSKILTTKAAIQAYDQAISIWERRFLTHFTKAIQVVLSPPSLPIGPAIPREFYMFWDEEKKDVYPWTEVPSEHFSILLDSLIIGGHRQIKYQESLPGKFSPIIHFNLRDQLRLELESLTLSQDKPRQRGVFLGTNAGAEPNNMNIRVPHR